MMNAATLTAINASRTTRLLSCHGRAKIDGIPRDSRTFKEYRNAIFLSADFQVRRATGAAERLDIDVFRGRPPRAAGRKP